MLTISQAVSRKTSGRARMAALAAILALSALAPAASANCDNRTSGGSGGSVSSAALASSSGSRSYSSIVGLWNVTFLSGGQVVDVAFDAWHADGIEILNDYTNPINGNVCLGVWAQTGSRSYKLKHPSWYFDGSGNLLGTVVIRETVRLSSDGNSYTGTYTYDIYDVSGNFQEELTGQIKATRISAD
ncbi:MAG TPA: hypothetical protein VLV49_03220 [Terriglobales bacterium]|nr:hypothetical protein [Terriglobales bacterium]